MVAQPLVGHTLTEFIGQVSRKLSFATNNSWFYQQVTPSIELNFSDMDMFSLLFHVSFIIVTKIWWTNIKFLILTNIYFQLESTS